VAYIFGNKLDNVAVTALLEEGWHIDQFVLRKLDQIAVSVLKDKEHVDIA
jgi:hypothetical protein